MNGTFNQAPHLVHPKIVVEGLFTERKKWSHFDLKSWVTGGTKIRSGIPSNWRIFESNWFDIQSQTDSIFRVKLTRYWESNWLDIESQTDSILRVKLTRYWESNCQFDSNIQKLLGIPYRILVPPVTQFFSSKWLIFFFQC